MARKPTPRRVVGLRVRGRVYRAVLTPDLKVGGYTVRVLGVPGCITEGDTLEEARRMAKEAIELWMAAAGPGKFRSRRRIRYRVSAHIDT